MTNIELNSIVNILRLPLCEQVYNYDCIKNYDNLITIINNLLKKYSDNEILKSESLIYLTDKLIKIIWKKLMGHQDLSLQEAEFFLYTLYHESIETLKLDKSKIVDMRFVNSGTKELPYGCDGIHKSLPNSDEKIYYDNRILVDLCDSNVTIVDKIFQMITICHELVHSQQCQHSYNNTIDLNAYIYSLECVFRTFHPDYYEDNYHFTRLESDANARGFAGVSFFIIKHRLLDSSKLAKISSMATNYHDGKITESLNHQIKYKEMEDNSGRVLLQSCSKFLKMEPDLIKKYKLLSISYNSDGSLKSIKQLFQTRTSLINCNPDVEAEINKIFEYIFNCYFAEKEIEVDKLKELYRYMEETRGTDSFAEKIFIESIRKKGGSEEQAKQLIKKYLS